MKYLKNKKLLAALAAAIFAFASAAGKPVPEWVPEIAAVILTGGQ